MPIQARATLSPSRTIRAPTLSTGRTRLATGAEGMKPARVSSAGREATAALMVAQA